MAFKGGYHLNNFLFKGLNVDTIEGFAGIFIGIVSIGIILEALRSLRDFYQKRCLENFKRTQVESCGEDQDQITPCISSILNRPGKNRRVAQIDTEPGPSSSQLQDTTSRQENQRINTDTEQTQNKSFLLFVIASILHSLYVILGYVAMLAVMTFNYWILIAITLGMVIGYFIFTYSRHLDIILADENEKVLEDQDAREHSSTPAEDPDRKLLLNNPEKINISSSDSSDNNSEKSIDGIKNNETVVGAQVHVMHESI